MDKEKLVGLIFVREPIWNRKNKSHHKCVILNKLWKEVAAECGVTATAARAQWKRLRQMFIKKLAEEPLKKSGDGVDDDNTKSEWLFHDSLLFLKDTCIPRTTEVSYLSDVDDGNESSRPASPMSPSTPILIKKAKKADNCKDAVGEALIRVEWEKIEYVKQKEEDRKKRREMVEESAPKKVVDVKVVHVKKFDHILQS